MKLSLPLLLSLPLAFLATAAPAPESFPEAELAEVIELGLRDAYPDPEGLTEAEWFDVEDDDETTPLDARETSPESLGLAKRKIVQCRVVNTTSATVNCRSGPGFNHKVVSKLDRKHYYTFDCYKKGPCYNGNCTWDRRRLKLTSSGWTHCYVNGYYTSSACTAKALGLC